MKDKIILALTLLLMSGCSMTGDGSGKTWVQSKSNARSMSLRCVVAMGHYIYVSAN